jgi:hypothetical protein
MGRGRRIVALLLVLVAVAACKKDKSSTTAPTQAGGTAVDSSCPPSTSPLNCSPATSLTIVVQVSATGASGNGPFSYTINGLTVSGSGTQFTRIVGLSPGTIEVSGQMQTVDLRFQIGMPPTNVGGSIPPGSLQNIEGPLGSQGGVSSCGVQYFQNPAGANFKFRFTLNAAGASDSCRQ